MTDTEGRPGRGSGGRSRNAIANGRRIAFAIGEMSLCQCEMWPLFPRESATRIRYNSMRCPSTGGHVSHEAAHAFFM